MIRKHIRAFTLMEILVVMALVAILASLAYTSYSDSLRKSGRGDAQAALTGLAIAMQRHYTEQTPSTYAGAAAGGGNTGAPSIYPTQSPIDGAKKTYNLQIQSASATAFELRAVPISGTSQASDECGTFTLTSAGIRGVTGAKSGTTWQDCWR